MKAVVLYKAGGSDRLVYTEVPTPKIKEGWSLVKVRGFGINRSEIFTRKGLSPSVVLPRILGIECVGEIAQSDVFAQGQKIISIMGEMGRAFDGSYAEYTLLPNTQIYPVESSLSWADLAAVPETCYTAYGSMKNMQIQENDRILIRAASSATAIAFVRLVRGKFPRAYICGSTQNMQKRELLLSQGYDDVIADTDYRLQSEESFDKILELVGPASIKDSLQHLKEYGILCSTGQLGHQWYLDTFDPIMELKNNVYLTTFYSGNVSAEKINEMLAYIEQYRIDIRPAKVFRLHEVARAHDYIESGQGFGKAVCVVDESY